MHVETGKVQPMQTSLRAAISEQDPAGAGLEIKKWWKQDRTMLLWDRYIVAKTTNVERKLGAAVYDKVRKVEMTKKLCSDGRMVYILYKDGRRVRMQPMEVLREATLSCKPKVGDALEMYLAGDTMTHACRKCGVSRHDLKFLIGESEREMHFANYYTKKRRRDRKPEKPQPGVKIKLVSIDGEGEYTIQEAADKVGIATSTMYQVIGAGRKAKGHDITVVRHLSTKHKGRNPVKLVLDGESGYTVKTAAKKIGAKPAAVYAALRRRGYIKGHKVEREEK